MIPGYATAEGTARYAGRFASYVDFYRRAADGLTISSLGLGTYLGAADEATDQAYMEAVVAALRGGINFIDTAINYRHQRSELSIRSAVREVINLSEAQRDELVICTKAGFLTPNAIPALLKPEDVAGGMHSMAPEFLSDQIDRSRANLDLETLDVFYLHNPETQLGFVSRSIFEERLRRAFAVLEQLVTDRKIGYYGTATWEGYRKAGSLDLARMIELATETAGEHHHFRFIQLPFNLGMVEAFAQRPESVLDLASRNEITVVASATLLQARLVKEMPDAINEILPGLSTNAQRAIQFTRSTPGITAALVGMSNPAHVRENLGVAAVPPGSRETYLQFYRR